ncbi:MAG TPA: SDR family NAD(P)-dependent oxidoreductase [Rhodospirillaceae bacterium]|nr:SDR family NAD(P)-dependent oxidoreductase [Rhodospirillaceae bacterium]
MSGHPPTPTALIIGASRGLGLALAAEYAKRGWQVTATQRAPSASGLPALAKQWPKLLKIETVDVTEPLQIAELKSRLIGRRFDLLFVNAGVANRRDETIGEVSTEEFFRVMHSNALGPMRVVEAFAELVPATGTIGIMSSGLASIANNDSGGMEVYRASKAALNTLMRSFSARHPGDPRSLLLIAPGWVRTDMGGPEATLGVDDSIPRVVDTILAQTGKAGLQFLDYLGQPVRW